MSLTGTSTWSGIQWSDVRRRAEQLRSHRRDVVENLGPNVGGSRVVT
jgi:hypothetical protein